MFKKNLIVVFVLGLLFIFVPNMNAQEKSTEKKENKTMMQDENMQKYMDKIASDGQMRGMMMSKMMEHMKADSSGMMQMCQMMMDNPGMHKMMMKMMMGNMMNGDMMNGDMMKDHKMMKDCDMMKDGKMMNDSTKTMNKSEHEKHHSEDKK